MMGEANFYGLYMPWLLLLALLALAIVFGLLRLLAAAGVYRHVWHPALFDIALYVLVLYAVDSISRLFQ